jgi:plastocyanin
VPARTLTAAAAVAAIAALVAGCGGDDAGHHENSAVPDGARTIAVTARDFEFEPAAIEVAAGEPIRIDLDVHNEPHDFVVDEAHAHVGGEEGETVTGGFTAPGEPGEYAFYCSIGNHRQLGMEGTLVVGQATP